MATDVGESDLSWRLFPTDFFDPSYGEKAKSDENQMGLSASIRANDRSIPLLRAVVVQYVMHSTVFNLGGKKSKQRAFFGHSSSGLSLFPRPIPPHRNWPAGPCAAQGERGHSYC